MKISRGDIFLANLDPTVGREIKKTRPVVVVSNDVNNTYAGTITIVPLTSQNTEKVYPFEALLGEHVAGLSKLSKALASQIRTLDKSRLVKRLGSLGPAEIQALNQAIKIHLAV